MTTTQTIERTRNETGATTKAQRAKAEPKTTLSERTGVRPERVIGAKRRAAQQAMRLALAAGIVNARRMGIAAGAVSTVLVALSLTHLAAAFTKVTACSSLEGYAMAVGIDLGFMVAELALITSDGEDKTMLFFAKAIAAITLTISAATNAMMFSGSENPVHRIVGIALGITIPALIFGLNQICARKIACANRLQAQLVAMEDAA